MMKKHRILNGLKKFVKFYNKNYIDIVVILVIALLLVIFMGATFAYGGQLTPDYRQELGKSSV